MTRPGGSRNDLRAFTCGLALAVGVLAVLPFVWGLLSTPAGGRYVGFQYNTDDHMVYAAWARQAMDGHFFFDNRFAVDPQPSLTIHLYFWAVGIVAKLVGIPAAAAIGRFVFGALFVLLLARLLRFITPDSGKTKLTLFLACFGAGIGFLPGVWQALGQDAAGSKPLVQALANGHLPNDVWQPEAFVFPCLLTNGLFSVSLCLIVGIFLCALKARESWKPVGWGALWFLLLMNIHSYDVLLLALVFIGFLVAAAAAKQITAVWFARVALMGLGAVPSALWFVHVLRSDPVFQARAATLTFTENFRSIFAGYLLFFLAALIGAVSLARAARDRRWLYGVGLFGVLVACMWFLAGSAPGSGYWMSTASWVLVYVVVLAALALLASPNIGLNLMTSWAAVGLVAPYFPGLFQRKLMMGLALPWAVLAGLVLWPAVQRLKGNERILVTALACILFAGTSLRWLLREFQLIGANSSNTTLHPVFLSPDAARIVDYLNDHAGGRTVVLAMPGIPTPSPDGEPRAPYYPDLNPILSGFDGVYTYAGHWSETPDYTKRRNAAMRFFLDMSLTDRRKMAREIGLNYLVAPVPEKLPLPGKGGAITHPLDLRDMGQVVVDGDRLRLIKI